MKKILAILFALVALFTFIACEDECTEHADADKNGSCDNCGATVEIVCESHEDTDKNGKCDICQAVVCPKEIDINLDGKCDNCGKEMEIKPTDETGKVLSQAVINQLKNANSEKIDLVLEFDYDEDCWVYDEETGKAVNEKLSTVGEIKLTFITSKTEKGSDTQLDMSLTIEKINGNGEATTSKKSDTLLYIIDGIAYEYSEELDAFLMTELPTLSQEDIDTIIGALEGELEMTEEEKNALITEIGLNTLVAFDVVNNRGSASIDFKPAYDRFVEYFNSLDIAKKTVRDVINDALALTNQELTVDELLLSVGTMYEMTVEEYLSYLDGILNTEYNTSVQGLYESLVGSEEFEGFFIGYYISQGSTEQDAKSMLEAMKLMRVEDLIPAEMMDVTVYDLLITLVLSDGEEAPVYPSVDEVMALIDSYLDMTLAEAVVNEMLPLSDIKKLVDYVELKKLKADLDLRFEGMFKISSVTGSIKLEASSTQPSAVEGKQDLYDIKATAYLKLYDISENKIPIAIPEDKEAYYDVFEKEFYDESMNLLCISAYDGEGYVMVMEYNDAVVMAQLSLSQLKSTVITVSGESLAVIVGEEIVWHDASQNLVVELNIAEGSFNIESMVNYEIPKVVETVVISYDTGMYGFFPDDGDLEREIDAGSKYTSHPVPVAIDVRYEFDGWYLNSTFTKKVTNNYVFEEDTTLYACWKAASSCVNPDGHEFSSWTTEQEASCTEDERASRTCIHCGKIETLIGSGALGHDWGEWQEEGFFLVRYCRRGDCKCYESKEIENLTQSLIDEGDIEVSSGRFFGNGLGCLIDGTWDDNNPIAPAPGTDFVLEISIDTPTKLDRIYVKGVGNGERIVVYAKYEDDAEYSVVELVRFLNHGENEAEDRSIPYIALDNTKKLMKVKIVVSGLTEATEYLEEIALARISSKSSYGEK